MDSKQSAFRLEVIAFAYGSCNYFSLHADYFSSIVIALEPHAIPDSTAHGVPMMIPSCCQLYFSSSASTAAAYWCGPWTVSPCNWATQGGPAQHSARSLRHAKHPLVFAFSPYKKVIVICYSRRNSTLASISSALSGDRHFSELSSS